MIRFLLNDQVIALADFEAGTTVLDWLRLERGLCGTKEGCASGDCGACTVVVAESAGNDLVYRSINSCITFLGALHGKQLLTVEHLADGDNLHPVQQAMVDYHGSQCGFCTPGFVMSLFALTRQAQPTGEAAKREAIHEHLGGNLCRCTGYRPIMDAALACTDRIAPDRFHGHADSVISRLNALAAEDDGAGSGGFLIPRSVAELAEMILAHPEAQLLGGGTDLALEVTQQLQQLDTIIYLGQVVELLQVDEHQDRLTLGAAVSLDTCRTIFGRHFHAIEQLLLRFGSRQVRNQGTIGGNIANASPIGDLPPVLLALDATLTLQRGAERRTLPVDDFFLDYRVTALEPGEFVHSVSLPLPRAGQFFRVYKVSKRLDDDISAVCIAIHLELEGEGADSTVTMARIGVGGMAAIPRRALASEQALIGSPFNGASVARAADAIADEFTPIDDARASADYRRQVARNLLQRCLMEWRDPDAALQVTDVH